MNLLRVYILAKDYLKLKTKAKDLGLRTRPRPIRQGLCCRGEGQGHNSCSLCLRHLWAKAMFLSTHHCMEYDDYYFVEQTKTKIQINLRDPLWL